MKISCTEQEKRDLITAIRYCTPCSFSNRDEQCEEMTDCEKCVEQSIEWQIEGGDGNG